MLRLCRLVGALAVGVAAFLAAGAPAASASTIVSFIPVGQSPEGISSDGTHVWVANFGDGTVTELNAADGSVVQTIPVGQSPEGISSDGTHVWVANFGGNTVTELDASDGSVVQTIPVGSQPFAVSSDGTHVWVANRADDTVTELDASDGSVVQTIPVGTRPEGVSSDGTHVWVTNSGDDTVTELDASDGSVVQTIPVGQEPIGISSDGTHVWVANFQSYYISEIDIATGAVVGRLAPYGSAYAVSADGASVWVTSGGPSDRIAQLDASVSGPPVSTFLINSLDDAISSDGTHAWVADAAANAVTEIQISPVSQSITFDAPPEQLYPAAPFTVSASASSNLPVSFTSDTPTVCAVAGSTVSVTATGVCTITASQAGDADYLPADLSQSFAVASDRTATALSETGGGGPAGPVTFTATVTDTTNPAGNPVTAGTVSFYDNGSATPLGTASSGTGAAAGTYTFTYTYTDAGPHSVVAVYTAPSGNTPYYTSTSAPVMFTESACSTCTDMQSIEATVPAGLLSIYTPYTATSPLNLGTLSMNAGGTSFTASALLDSNPFDTPTAGAEPADPTFDGITVVDTQAGNLPWTVTALATPLADGGSGLTSTISAQNVGLTGLRAIKVPGNALSPADLTFTDSPAASPPAGPADAGSAGLGGGTPHLIVTDAGQADGTIGINGTITLTAPTSTQPGTYVGTITFTIAS